MERLRHGQASDEDSLLEDSRIPRLRGGSLKGSMRGFFNCSIRGSLKGSIKDSLKASIRDLWRFRV